MSKRIQQKPPSRLCDCGCGDYTRGGGEDRRVRIAVHISCGAPLGCAELHIDYETCPNCAFTFSTGGLKKIIKKALKEYIEKHRDFSTPPYKHAFDVTLPGRNALGE